MKAAGNVSCAAQPKVFFLSLNNKTSGVRTARTEAEMGVLHPQCVTGPWDSVPCALGHRDAVGSVM